jgi:hypothetical protein
MANTVKVTTHSTSPGVSASATGNHAAVSANTHPRPGARLHTTVRAKADDS